MAADDFREAIFNKFLGTKAIWLGPASVSLPASSTLSFSNRPVGAALRR